MKKVITIITVLGVLSTLSTAFCQEKETESFKKNRISVQSGLFHYFFDNAPILNVNYREFNGIKRPGVFNQLLISSVGLRYERALNYKNRVGIEIMSFHNNYWKHLDMDIEGDFFNPPEPVALGRRFLTINIDYTNIIWSSNKLSFLIGGGLIYRRGSESIIVNQGKFGPLLEGSFKNDIGLNIFSGIEYTPVKWLTIYSKIDLIGLVYLHDKESIEKLEYYSKMPGHFPSRFDLSFKLGLGVNF